MLNSTKNPILQPLSPSVKVQTVTKFTWPKNYYPGSLISVSSRFIAYVIRGKSDAVRVLNRHTATRVLLKGFAAPVCDISFAQGWTFCNFRIRAITFKISRIPTQHIERKYGPDSKLQVESICSIRILGILEGVGELSFRKSQNSQSQLNFF